MDAYNYIDEHRNDIMKVVIDMDQLAGQAGSVRNGTLQ